MQEELAELVRENLKNDYGQIIDLIPIERGKGGHLSKLKIVGTKHTMIIGKELEIRRVLSPNHLYSSAFVVDKENIQDGIPGKFILTGAGWGHGVGMCQIGAAVMLPYLLNEIKTGFLNVQYAMNMRSGLSSIPFPQVYALILFPTNEISALFGSRIGSIIYYWFTKPIYFYGLIFLFISIIFSAFVFIKSFIFLLKRKNVYSDKEEILKELIFILFLFIPVTIISFIVFKSKSGTFHYLYSAYSISFVPILLFFIQNENKLKDSRKYFIITAVICSRYVILTYYLSLFILNIIIL